MQTDTGASRQLGAPSEWAAPDSRLPYHMNLQTLLTFRKPCTTSFCNFLFWVISLQISMRSQQLLFSDCRCGQFFLLQIIVLDNFFITDRHSGHLICNLSF